MTDTTAPTLVTLAERTVTFRVVADPLHPTVILAKLLGKDFNEFIAAAIDLTLTDLNKGGSFCFLERVD